MRPMPTTEEIETIEAIYADLDNETRAREAEIVSDPLAYFHHLAETYLSDEDWQPPPFVAAAPGSTAKVSYSFRVNREDATLRLIDARGQAWIVTARYWSDSGSYWQPPESEIEIDWQAP